MEIFERCMWTDMKRAIPVTLLLVFIIMFAYTGSVFYSGVVLASAAFSFTISYFLYFTVFKVTPPPLHPVPLGRKADLN